MIGVIYESRPNVTADVAALSLKSGNCSILRGGSESFNTNKLLEIGWEPSYSSTEAIEKAISEIIIEIDE